MAETSPSRTTTRKPRTKAASSGTETRTPVRRTVRKRATTTTTTATAPLRKAPSTVARQETKRRPLLLYSGIAAFILVIGISAIIGMTAEGQINVASTIVSQTDQEHVVTDGSAAPAVMPSQRNEQPVNSGLVPSTGQPTAVTPPPPVETASSTAAASSNGTTASSTEGTTDTVDEAEATDRGQTVEETGTVTESGIVPAG